MAVAFVGAGTGVTLTGTNATVDKTGCTIGNVVILQVLVDTSSAFPYINSATGCEKIDGTDNDLDLVAGIQVGATDAGAMRTWIGRATGTTVTLDVNANSSTNDMFMRIYEFSGVSTNTILANVLEDSGAQNQGTGTTVTAATVTSTVADGFFLNLVGITASQAVGSFTGETGGDWTEAVAEYIGGGTVGTIQLQTATRASAGAISGGSISITSNPWGIQGGVLIPATAGGGGGGPGAGQNMTMLGVG